MQARLTLVIGIFLGMVCFGQTQRERLAEGYRLKDAWKLAEARAIFEEALRSAGTDAAAEADARRGLGHVLSRTGELDEARRELEKARVLYERLGNRAGLAQTYGGLGYVEWATGNRQEERAWYQKALTEFEAIGSPEQALIKVQLMSTASGMAERRRLAEEGLRIATESGDKRLQGLLLSKTGEIEISEGNLAGAKETIERAVAMLGEIGAREQSAALVALSRIYRTHGMYDKTLEMQRKALAIEEESGDPVALSQTLDAVASTYSFMRKQKEEIAYAERALEVARRTGSKRLILRQLLGLASSHSVQRNYKRAVELFEEAIAAGAETDEIPWRNFAYAYRGVKDKRALPTADKAVDWYRRKRPEFLHDTLRVRALIRWEGGDLEGALRDVDEGLQVIEKQRAGAVRTDAMKRGFAEQMRLLFTLAVELLHEAGRYGDAVEVAESARSRAFLDLLASREAEFKPRHQEQIAALQGLERELQAAGQAPSKLSVSRGGSGTEKAWQQWRGADPELRSFVTAEPLSIGEMAATAKRLQSTMLVYWVNRLSMYLWVVQPDGKVGGARVEVGRDEIERHLAKMGAGGAGRSRGEGDPEVAMRGGASVGVGGGKEGWRQLYKWLIEPVRHLLPAETGSLLTVVPHGPLFQVSFAALADERGKYLVEKYRLHSVPAGAVLEFTKAKKRGNGGAGNFLLVADPAGMTGADGKALAALPGSRREVRAIANLFPASRVTVLTGTAAREETIREAAGGKAVLHFATHGILRQDQPFESFLALGRRSGEGSGDGRLTAREVYQLDLDADLVVLSACRSALGAVSADGMIGLTRAFFYAGTPSVMATVWDVADEPTSRLLANFYDSYRKSAEKTKALREAQLKLIGDLRAGRVQVETPLGAVTLPEHPVFWAGFVLLGEP